MATSPIGASTPPIEAASPSATVAKGVFAVPPALAERLRSTNATPVGAQVPFLPPKRVETDAKAPRRRARPTVYLWKTPEQVGTDLLTSCLVLLNRIQ